MSSSIRTIADIDEKAAHICFENEELKLSEVVRDLGGNYQKAWRRLKALEDGRAVQKPGRPALIHWNYRDEIQSNIARSYKERCTMHYGKLQDILQNMYSTIYNGFSEKTKEKRPKDLPKKYCYSAAKRLNLNTQKPKIMEYKRIEHATSQTIIDFFIHTYTKEFSLGIHDDLCFNADETHAEIKPPTKVILPDGIEQGVMCDKFTTNSHITAMITINAAGDQIPPYLLLPKVLLPKTCITFVQKKYLNIGGSPNGWMNDENFVEWGKWFIAFVIELRKERGYPPDQRAVLFLDGHGTRNNKEMMQLFKNAYIDVIIFPSHLTHLMQPFDVIIAAPFKKALSELGYALLSLVDHKNLNESEFIRLVQVVAIIDAHRKAVTITNCSKAFSNSGLFPRDPEIVLGKKNVKKSTKSFIDFPKPDCATINISGKCITSDDIQPCLRSPDDKKKKKAEKISEKVSMK